VTEKIGRNDLCSCGSGKKYKQCCMKKKLPLGKRKFKASVISTGKKAPDLMERTFGNAIRAAQNDTKPPIISNNKEESSEKSE
jgi:uncharacterized protein